MKIKEDYLLNFNNKLLKIIEKDSSFNNLYNLLLNDKIKLSSKYNYDEILMELNQIKDLLNKITSIIYKPHIKSVTSEIIIRSEVSNNLSTESFIKTTKDPKLWKNKNNNLTPEYVYSNENIDSLDTYENRFISLLINEINNELKIININISPLIESIEEFYGVNGLTFGKNSIINDLASKNYPYNGFFNKEKGNKKIIIEVVKNLNNKLKRLKESEFYKITKNKFINKNVIPTNILIHDPLYNYCYRYYKDNFNNENNIEYDKYYYNYVLINFISTLSKLKVGSTSINNKINLKFEEKRLIFKQLTFKKGLFSFILSEDNNNLGFYIETRLINKAIKVNTKVDKNYINSNYVLTSFNYLESNKEKITNALKNINVNNRTIFTMNNLLSEYKNVITLSYYKDNQYELLINYLKSLVLLFDTDLDLFKSKCPICGQNEINFDGFNYHCKNCRSTFSFNETVKGPLMWIKNMRRDY